MAKKLHKCIWCGEAIPAGMKYRHEFSKYCGDVQNHKFHLECYTSMQKYIDAEEDGEFEPYMNERPHA